MDRATIIIAEILASGSDQTADEWLPDAEEIVAGLRDSGFEIVSTR